jgi:integrase
VLKVALRRKLIATNPFDVLADDERPTRGESEPAHEWTPEEETALLAAARQLAQKPESRYDYSPVLQIVLTLGLRLGEVLGLQWQDFDREESVVNVRRQWTRYGEYGPTKTKAGKRRVVLPHDLRDELIALRLRSPFSQDGDPIFASRAGTPLTHRNVTRRGFEAARDLAGLPATLTFHDTRHAVASKLIAANVDDVYLADFIGHGDATVTRKVYGHVRDRHRKDEAVRLALAGGL